LLIAQTKVINETFLKLFAVKAQPYFKKPCGNIRDFSANFANVNVTLDFKKSFAASNLGEQKKFRK